MSVVAAQLVLASGVQGGDAPAAGYETLVICAVIVVMAAFSALIGIYLRRRAGAGSAGERPVAGAGGDG